MKLVEREKHSKCHSSFTSAVQSGTASPLQETAEAGYNQFIICQLASGFTFTVAALLKPPSSNVQDFWKRKRQKVSEFNQESCFMIEV